MISRELYTKIFLKELDRSTDEASVKMLMNKIWQSRRTKEGGGLRLSLEGYEFLVDEVKLESYEVPFSEHIELSPQTIIFFDRFMDCPYLLTSQSLIVFSEKKAFELHIFSDDIRKYGLVKAMNARKKEQDLDKSEDF
jgi:hypothetical protein